MSTNKINKNIIIIILIIIFTFLIVIWLYKYIKKENTVLIYDKNQIINNENIEESRIKEEGKIEVSNNINKGSEEISKSEKIQNFRKSLAAKWLIINWDKYLENYKYIFALRQFLKANRQDPNNPEILSKIAETHFLMKNFWSAYNFFLRVENSDYINKNQKTLSFLFSQKIENIDFAKSSTWVLSTEQKLILNNIKKEIKTFWLEKENEFYYINSLKCIYDFDYCIKNFINFFESENYSWNNKNLENIKVAIKNFNNLKLDKLYYKKALVIWALLQNDNFPVSIVLSKELLKEKPTYRSLLKIVAQSYFELNNLEQADKFLLKYARINSKSPDVSYMIWIIAQKNKDFLRSNIFLNLALKQWYKHKEFIYRAQLYNYIIMWESNKIAKIFDKIIEIQDIPNFNDLLLWTYYNIINNNLEKALILSNKWIKHYPEKEDFYWFKAWLLIEQWYYIKAEELLKKASKINPRNALIVLNKWRIYKIKYEKSQNPFHKAKAKLFFKRAVEFDSSEIWELANTHLKEFEN